MAALSCSSPSLRPLVGPPSARRAGKPPRHSVLPSTRAKFARALAPRARQRRALSPRQPLRTFASAGCEIAHTPAARTFDFLVLGSGIAGLSYALKVAQYGSVAVVTKGAAFDGCTQYAQGGVCAVLDALDSVEAHIQDTIVAGDFLNRRKAVEVVCREGPSAVLELAELGAQFTRGAGGSLHLTREGGHSARRIVHAADVTGREIERALLAAAAAEGNITFFEDHLAVDLVWDEVAGVKHCLGVDALNTAANAMTRFVAPVTLLATGGAGQVYPVTTNPAVATGDGMAMAFRAKAAVANMEFVQFHPTAFCPPARAGPLPLPSRAFLISEAVRGEGGRLYNLAGDRFMSRIDSRKELAPRDVVARAIHAQMAERGDPHVLLDVSHAPAAEVLAHFPNIAAHCATAGVDITREPIPVAPAQHYMCGGVQTGLFGETSVAGLYAAGEVACTGLHGANRLASNSLLEGLVFAARATGPSVAHANAVARSGGSVLRHAAASADFTGSKAPAQLSAATREWVGAKRRQLTTTMWRGAGIVRRRADIKAALQEASLTYLEAKALAESYGVAPELVELRNLATVGELILASALRRRESRGGHYVLDHPLPMPDCLHATVVSHPLARKAVLLAKAPRSSLAPRTAGLIERAGVPRAREVALRSQKESG